MYHAFTMYTHPGYLRTRTRARAHTH